MRDQKDIKTISKENPKNIYIYRSEIFQWIFKIKFKKNLASFPVGEGSNLNLQLTEFICIFIDNNYCHAISHLQFTDC